MTSSPFMAFLGRSLSVAAAFLGCTFASAGSDDPLDCGELFAARLRAIQGSDLDFPKKFRLVFGYKPQGAYEQQVQDLPRFRQFLESTFKFNLIQASQQNHKYLTLQSGRLPPETRNALPPWLSHPFIDSSHGFFSPLKVMWPLLLANEPSPMTLELQQFCARLGLTLHLLDASLRDLKEGWLRAWDFQSQQWEDWVPAHHATHPRIQIFWSEPHVARTEIPGQITTFASKTDFYRWFEVNEKYSREQSVASPFAGISFAELQEYVNQHSLDRKDFLEWVKNRGED